MIDWTATSRELGHGTECLNLYRPKVICRCDNCNEPHVITIRVKSKINNNQQSWQCSRCVGGREEVRAKLSKSTTEQWKDDSYKSVRSKSSLDLWNDQGFKSKHHNAVNTVESRSKCSDAAIKAWSDPVYRSKHAISLANQLVSRPKTEIKFDTILLDLGIAFDTNYVVGPYTFDYIIERIARPKLLIEINGNYWHTRPYVMRKDAAKSSYIDNLNDFELKTIWENQLSDVDRLKTLVAMWVGREPQRRHINLCDIEFKIADIDDMRRFMSNYHYLGGMGRSGTCIGGYIDDEMVCGAIMAHPTRREMYVSDGLEKSEMLELTRFAISSFVHNHNLGSFFLSKLINFVPHGTKSIVSYADPSAGHYGTIYKAANWKFAGDTKPSYFYVNGEGWKMHKKTLYNQAKAMHMNENEFATKFNYKRVNSPPLKKYKLEIDQ